MSTVAETVPRVAGDAPASRKPTAAGRTKADGAKQAMAMLPDLVDAMLWNRRDELQSRILHLIEVLEAPYPTVVRRLRRHEHVTSFRPTTLPMPKDLILFDQARHGFADVILPPDVASQCRDICAEHDRAAELAKFDLAPRHRILLNGPPGNGKTMLAEAFAYELDLPLLRVRYSGLVTSYMGDTSKNLDKVFEYAATAPSVLFFDEFDTVSAQRGQSNDVGEMRRVTNQLLVAIDMLPAHCVLVAATNLLGDLDPAVRRRFDFTVELPAPTHDLRVRAAKKELDPKRTPGIDVSHLAEKVAQLPCENLAELVRRCREIRRDLVLNAGQGVERLTCAKQGLHGGDQAYREELEARGQLRLANA
ncbi:AAA family ATPase [Burkholderia gladioli]|uniref:AAA family ATPase n=1 Tax=Burkholderia gladioli TaxID=28095 RepID=A0A2A7SA24_BURGA|nr:ATP-binding protein [Burkholderia gladioli]PEH40416.1 AAA family ATPase [Burkholderia gladioli]